MRLLSKPPITNTANANPTLKIKVKVLSIYVGEKDLDNRLEFVSPFQYDVGTSFSFSDIILCEDKEELLLFFDSACFHLRKVK